MNFPLSKLEKLVALVHAFCSEIDWQAPHALEREPAYTRRVLQPEFENFVKNIKEPGLTLRSDGDHRPTPVSFDKHDFYPDIGINFYQERIVAFECKYISKGHLNSQLSMAIGQAITYCSQGYQCGIVLLISRNGEQVIASEVIKSINELLNRTPVRIFELCAS